MLMLALIVGAMRIQLRLPIPRPVIIVFTHFDAEAGPIREHSLLEFGSKAQ